MLRIWFEVCEFAFECLESLSNGLNLDMNASNSFQMFRLPFEWFEFAFDSFESISNCSNLHSNASIPFRMVRISIRMRRIPLERLEFGFE